MRASKWLASSVILFILLRALVRSGPILETNTNGDHGESNQRLLSRSKRFSMNEYLMLALSVFNVFVFLYNNIETFFPATVKTSSKYENNILRNRQESIQLPPPTAAPPLIITSPPPITDQNNLFDDSFQVNQDRELMIDQIAEMLIR